MASYTAQSRESGRAPLPIDSRRDAWWTSPLAFILVMGAFVVYTTYRTFENAYYEWGPYLSPFYSPLLPLKIMVPVPGLGVKMISPAIYILIFPLAFRMSCYYYRKAYYRAFFGDPPGCAVAEPFAGMRMRYTGERAFPWILQNCHRFAFYAAVVFIVILGWDTILAFQWHDAAAGTTRLHIGLGTVVFLVNWVLLTAYTFGCHSCRHLIGGGTDCYTCSSLARTRHGLWRQVSFLNARHALFAWASMISVALADLYVNLVARGIIADPHILF